MRKKRKAEQQAKSGRKKDTGPRPIQDEWGLYDPNACGFEALFAKLESLDNDDSEAEEGPSAADRLAHARPAAAPPRTMRGPRPMAMWVCHVEPPALAEPASTSSDEFRGLVSQFSIPHAVAAVSYARGATIRRVDVPAMPDGQAAADADAPVVILSRSLLKSLRQPVAAPRRLTARR